MISGASETPSLDSLLRQLENPYVYDRIRAIDTLGNLKDPRAIQPLIEALKDSEHYAAEDAAKALAKYGPTAFPALIKAFDHPEPQVRVWAVGAVWMSGQAKQILPELLSLLSRETTDYVRLGVIGVLGDFQDPSITKAVLPFLESPDAMMKMSAAQTLGKQKDPKAVPALVKELTDERPSVVSNIHWALCNIAGQDFGTDAKAWLKWARTHKPLKKKTR